MSGWWPRKVRQFVRHVSGRVTAREREALRTWLTPAQVSLFDSMHRADQRHGLDVAAELGRSDIRDRDLLLAGLLHDCGKGPSVGLRHRVAWSLGELLGGSASSAARRLPGFADAFDRIARHAEESASMSLAAGCSPRTAALILHQAAPVDGAPGEALRLADEAH